MDEFTNSGRVISRLEIHVKGPRRLVAEAAAAAASRKLGIPTPPVRFFYRSPEDDGLFGYAADGEVCIAADLSDRDTVCAVLHEVRHIWQQGSPEWRYRDEAAKERDARLFELEWPR